MLLAAVRRNICSRFFHFYSFSLFYFFFTFRLHDLPADINHVSNQGFISKGEGRQGKYPPKTLPHNYMYIVNLPKILSKTRIF